MLRSVCDLSSMLSSGLTRDMNWSSTILKLQPLTYLDLIALYTAIFDAWYLEASVSKERK